MPLAAVGAAFAETFVVDQGLWINFTDGVYVGPAIPQYAAWRFTEATGRLLLLAALFAAVAALAVLVDARRWRWASALAPVIAAGVVWAGAAAPVYRSDHDPRAAFPVHCSGHKPVMCWSGDGDRPPAQLTAVARHLDGRLRGVENAPTHYADVTEVTSDDESGYAPHESEPGHTAMVSLYPDRESTFRDTVDALVGRRTDDTATPSHRPADALAQWLLPPDLRAPAYRRDVRRIDSLSAAARTAWLGHCLDVADHGGPLPPLPLLPPSSTKATEP
ncbi:hypothetical protein ACFQ0X_15490 [Streptomyces rectiviolaceus]|uniref:hypothetical protein n=1 Tax=Streptomyces rectiviolaceus TaxID=332591 RepID=UPI00363C1401